MSFLDLYQGDQDAQEAHILQHSAPDLPSTFSENFNAAWSDGQLFSQSTARQNARSAVVSDYIDEIRQKTGNDLSKDFNAEGGGVIDYATANARVAAMKQDYPDLDIPPLTEDEIDKRAVAKAQAAHRTYEQLNEGEKTAGGSFGSFVGSSAAAATDPINIVALGIAPETGGIGILSAALRWGALAGVSQAGIEFASDQFKEQVQPGYTESGQPLREIGGAFLGGAVLGGATKALGNAWTRVKTGQWPTSVRDAGNIIESEANVASTNPFPGAEGEVAHREALTKTIDDILAGRPVDVSQQITPELTQAAIEAERANIVPEPPSGLPPEQLPLPFEPAGPNLVVARQMPDGTVKIGEPGQVHSDLMTRAELKADTDSPEIAASMGYADKQGRFLDRQQALEYAAKNEPERAAYALDEPQYGLEASAYNEALPSKKGKTVPIDQAGLPPLQTPEEMSKTLAAPDHQEAIRADIDRARAMGDVKVPGVDEFGNHTMIGVDAAIDEVDAYKKLADDIQACANPVQEAAE